MDTLFRGHPLFGNEHRPVFYLLRLANSLAEALPVASARAGDVLRQSGE
jgi:hypothetical protein